jgi:predicted Ser/Thr protein kinase
MLSLRQSLQQTLPKCDLELYNDTSTSRSDARSQPNDIVNWTSLVSEMNRFYVRQIDADSSRFEAMRANVSTFQDILDVQAQLRQTLFRTAQILHNGCHIRQVQITPKGGIPGTRTILYEPDLIAWRYQLRDGEPIMLLPIEVKKPHGLDDEDLRQLSRDNPHPNQKIIQQEIGYLERNNCEFGIISNYISTYALRLDGERNIVSISEPFKYFSQNPTVLEIIYFILSKALDSKGLKGKAMHSLVESASKKRKARAIHTPSNSDTSPTDIQNKHTLKSRKTNIVLRGNVKGRSVILKKAHISKADALRHEIDMYGIIEELQRKTIPKLLSKGIINDTVYMILEDCGSPITNLKITNRRRNAISQAIDSIHKLQVYHGDLATRNVILNGSRAYIIDFEDSCVVEKTQIAEKKEFMQIFDS